VGAAIGAEPHIQTIQEDALMKGEARTCRDCGEQFTLRADDIEYFSRRAMELPKRCVFCRLARRKARTEEERMLR
jgi:hypothetical protein